MFWVLKRPVPLGQFFENPKHMFRSLGKKMMTILRSNFLLSWTYVSSLNFWNILAYAVTLPAEPVLLAYKLYKPFGHRSGMANCRA